MLKKYLENVCILSFASCTNPPPSYNFNAGLNIVLIQQCILHIFIFIFNWEWRFGAKLCIHRIT